MDQSLECWIYYVMHASLLMLTFHEAATTPPIYLCGTVGTWYKILALCKLKEGYTLKCI